MTKLNNILDKMIKDSIGECLLQETRKDGNKFNEEVNSLHISNHNYDV